MQSRLDVARGLSLISDRMSSQMELDSQGVAKRVSPCFSTLEFRSFGILDARVSHK